jgi:hypothetical protein
MRVEKGIRWLAERIGAIEALSTLSPFEREVLGAVHSLHDEYAPVEMTVTFKDIREHVGVSSWDPTGILEVGAALKRLESRGWIHEDIGVYEPIDKKC